jgi:peptidoglycan/xylan/chitin deacetylase (PgdA/CDA1 family)
MRWMFALGAALLLGVGSVYAAETNCEVQEGGIVRGPTTDNKIALEFSADQFVEGGPTILDELASHHAKASFFLTGRCVRRAENKPLITRMIRDGHYVGPHSNSHPLLCPWTGKKRTLVTRNFFTNDLNQNLLAIQQFGVARTNIRYFLPPYEWYNDEVSRWTRDMGMVLINHTPGTRSAADYTEEKEHNFLCSEKILQSIIDEDKRHTLKGHLLLLHLGSGPQRKDKMHRHIGELIDYLQKRGYELVRVDELLKDCNTVAVATSANN